MDRREGTCGDGVGIEVEVEVEVEVDGFRRGK